MKRIIAVIGPSRATEEERTIAYETGRLIAKEGWILINGGKGGIMEASSKGAFEEGGITVGILPEDTTDSSNPYIAVPIATGLGDLRNCIIVCTAEAICVIGMSPGTLTEVAYAIKWNKTLVGLLLPDRYSLPIKVVKTAEEAIKEIKRCIIK